MSPASLAIVHPARPDRVRIIAISTALAFNLAVIVATSRPAVLVPPHEWHAVAPVPVVRLIEPPRTLPPPPAVELKPLRRPLPQASTRQTVKAQPDLPRPVPVAVPTDAPVQALVPVPHPRVAPAVQAPQPPVGASLAYRSSPLHFPPQALRQRMQGVVLLRVLVDETGRPLQVLVEHGSGYAVLDRSAREQVMGWRFRPAIDQGRPARAWARVPVDFSLADR